MENNKQLLARLRAVDFALYETVLYLDAYPDNAEALAYYRKLVEQREAIVADYERTVGPLTFCGNGNRTTWDWTKSPWPWEYDAN